MPELAACSKSRKSVCKLLSTPFPQISGEDAPEQRTGGRGGTSGRGQRSPRVAQISFPGWEPIPRCQNVGGGARPGVGRLSCFVPGKHACDTAWGSLLGAGENGALPESKSV